MWSKTALFITFDDMSVTAAGDPGYLRRLAGHVETGRPSISDPAFGNS